MYIKWASICRGKRNIQNLPPEKACDAVPNRRTPARIAIRSTETSLCPYILFLKKSCSYFGRVAKIVKGKLSPFEIEKLADITAGIAEVDTAAI